MHMSWPSISKMKMPVERLTQVCAVHFVRGVDTVCVEHLAPAKGLWSCLNDLDDGTCRVTD
jgi:hypothetical protein